MKNRRALFSAVTSMTMLALAVIACEEEKKSEFDEQNKPDTGVGDTGPGFVRDAQTEKETAALSCSPKIPTDFAGSFKAVEAKAVCEYAQLSGYYTACLADDGSGNAGLRSTKCEEWKAAAATSECAACIENADNTGPLQTFKERLYYDFNFAGCVAIKQKASAKGSCAESFDTLASCRRVSCDNCFDLQGVKFSDFQACRVEAVQAGGDCVRYQTTADSACVASGSNDAGSSNYAGDCFGTKGEAEGDVFVRLAAVFCGK